MVVSVNRSGLLAGKVAVVTGASRGIGEAIALRFAAEGANVVVSARTLDDGDHVLAGGINAVVQRIIGAGGEALPVRADLALPEDREALIAKTRERFGAVDILVNNAAVTYYAPVRDFTDKRYRLMMEVQVRAPFHLAQLVLPDMIDRRSGWILNISSHAAIHPQEDAGARGGTVYGMCKAALERFTTGLASEVYDDYVGVNVISPGLVATPGAVYHRLTEGVPERMITPVGVMSEACLRLVHGDPRELTGRVTYAADVMKEFDLTPAELIA